MLNKNTAALLRDMYQLAHIQATLEEQDLSLSIDWAGYRSRIEKALVWEGLEVPERAEVQVEEEKEENNV